MAVATKTALSPVPPLSTTEAEVERSAPAPFPKPVKLDFTPNPNLHRANRNGKVKKATTPHGARVDLSPRLELSLEVQCDAAQEQDPEME